MTRVNDLNSNLRLRAEIAEEIVGSSLVKIGRRFPEAEIRFDPPGEIMTAMMDPLLIEQVLINLVENSIRHSGSKKPIEISLEHVEDDVRFVIRDFGRGLPEDIIRQILDDSPVMVDRRADSSRGMGIGLSVCQSILKAHGSRLYAENAPEGVCFRFSLRAGENIIYDEAEVIDR